MESASQHRRVTTFADRNAWETALLATPLEKGGITNGDKVVGMRLIKHLNLKTGRCFPTVAPTLTRGTALSRQAVQGALKRLTDDGWIRRAERAGSSSTFEFLMTCVPVEQEGVPTGVGTPSGETAGEGCQPELAPVPTGVGGGCQPQLAHNIEPNLERNRESISTDDLNEGFEQWFAAYPRREDRGPAFKAFSKVVTSGQATFEDLMEGAQRYADARDGEDHTFTKKPARWLADECWKDDPVKPTRSNGSVMDAINRRVASFSAKPRHSLTEQGGGRPVRQLTYHQERQVETQEIREALRRVAEGEGVTIEGQRVPDASTAPAPAVERPAALPAPPAAPVVRAPPVPKPKPLPPRPDPQRGRYEMEIRAALGPDVFDQLDEAAVDGLCKRWKAKRLPQTELEAIRLQHQRTATAPPAAKVGTG